MHVAGPILDLEGGVAEKGKESESEIPNGIVNYIFTNIINYADYCCRITYSVSLTVTDEYGATNTTTESVKVSGGISALTDEFDSITEIMILVLKVSVIASLITFCIGFLRFKR